MGQLCGGREHLVGLDTSCLAGLARGGRNDSGDVTYSLCPALSEHHTLARLQVFRVLDETEVHTSFVPCPQALL